MTERDFSDPLVRNALAPSWSRYLNFPTFSWAWCMERSRLFVPLALAYGLGVATWHATGVNDWASWPGFALRACLASLLVVGAGPLMAAVVRRSGLPLRVEQVLVVVAIVLGLYVAQAAVQWAVDHHHMLMELSKSHSMKVPALLSAVSDLLSVSLNGSGLVLILGGGGFALISYLTERRRLADYASKRELDAMREQRDEAELRLSVLQAQVEPHFLFNTLASVRSLVATDPRRAAATIDAMADYFRSTLPSLNPGGESSSTLGRQVDICTRYLDLMNIRTDDRIRIGVDVDPAARKLFFPPLVLLTLVENAVKHGVGPKPGPVAVTIGARLRGDGSLEVAVEDDGAGLSTGESHGMGLANVRAQLRNLFGSGAALSIANRPGGGTRAAIVIGKATA